MLSQLLAYLPGEVPAGQSLKYATPCCGDACGDDPACALANPHIPIHINPTDILAHGFIVVCLIA